jgi:hypothetical protein
MSVLLGVLLGFFNPTCRRPYSKLHPTRRCISHLATPLVVPVEIFPTALFEHSRLFIRVFKPIVSSIVSIVQPSLLRSYFSQCGMVILFLLSSKCNNGHRTKNVPVIVRSSFCETTAATAALRNSRRHARYTAPSIGCSNLTRDSSKLSDAQLIYDR